MPQTATIPSRLVSAITPVRAACALFGFLLLSVAIGPALKSSFGAHGVLNDFLSFYTGAKLLPRGKLYNYKSTLDLQRHLGMMNPPMVYDRLPFYALLFSPLARLDYKNAYLIFQIASILSFALAVLCWRRFGAGTCLLLAGWSSAMAFTLLRGQDVAFVFLFASASAALLRKEYPFSAGAILALGLIKWHFLLLFPLMIIAKKLTRFGLGFASGVGVLILLSFAAYSQWPSDYWHVLQMTQITPHLTSMPNLWSLVHGGPGGLALQTLGIALGAVLCWCAFRSESSLDEAMAISLLAGVIFSTHAYAYDCVLMLPAVAAAASRLHSRPNFQFWLAIGFGACPVLLQFKGGRFIAQFAFLALFLWLSMEVIRRGKRE
ncbi:MAG TPA: glycosyltransferase family 87 protein [Bryobacteraceae bacterium]|nr:glycosyltransferase family 87 protein [Bryobacteraceae bacterium]